MSGPPWAGTWPTGRGWVPDYLGGPFEDRTGGLITFEAQDTERARRAVDADPFIRDGLLEAHWLKQWTPQ